MNIYIYLYLFTVQNSIVRFKICMKSQLPMSQIDLFKFYHGLSKRSKGAMPADFRTSDVPHDLLRECNPNK